MSKWKIVDKEVTTASAIAEAMTLGIAPREYVYTVENTGSGETKEVTAFSDDHAGRQIAAGKFNKED
jgi:hypothetical protein